MITRKNLPAIVLCALILLSTTTSFAVDRDFNKVDTIRIGVLAPVQMSPGQGIINPAKMAAEEINAAGGVNGKKIELVVGDTENKPERGLTAFKKLVLDDKVDVVVGEYNSGVALTIEPHLSNYRVVFIGTGTASTDLTVNVEKNYDKYKYFFRQMVNADRQMQFVYGFIKEYVHDKLGYKKIAILAENASWTKDFSSTLKDKLEAAGIPVVFNQRFDVDMKDFSPIFNNIKTAGAEWILQVVSHGASIPLVKAWQESQAAPMGGVNVAGMDQQFWGVTGGACLYEITDNMVARSPLTDKTIAFWDKYVKQFGTNPVYDTGWTYDTIFMLAKVIGQKKSLKTDDIIDGLENIDYHGILHPHSAFDKKSHDVLEGRFTMVMVQWQKDGTQVVVYPEEFKTGEFLRPAWKK